MRYGRIVFGIVGVLALVVGAGLLHRAGSQIQAEDPGTAQERALATAKRFLTTVGVPIPTVEVRITQRNETWRGRSVWEVAWNGMATVRVTADGSSVVGFANDWRIMQQVRRWDRTGRSMFRSDDEVRAFVTRMARALGIPQTARLEGYTHYADDTPGRGDTNRAGKVGASFRIDAHGYPFVAPGGPGGFFEADPQDGALVHFHASYNHVAIPDPPAPPRLTRTEAEKLAVGPYLKHRKPLFRRATAPTNAKLGWVSPNPWLGSGYSWDNTMPTPVRLAWVVYFGAEAVFIDPYDGSVLGGLETKGMNRETAARFGGQRGSSQGPR